MLPSLHVMSQRALLALHQCASYAHRRSILCTRLPLVALMFVFTLFSTIFLTLATTERAQAQTIPGCVAGACITTGTRLADVGDGDLLDGVYGSLLGTDEPLQIDVADWQGLAGATVTLGDLQEELNLATPEALLNESLTLNELFSALLGIDGLETLTALDDLVDVVGTIPNATTEITLGQLLQINSGSGAFTDIHLNVLDLTTGAIQLFNHENFVTTPAPITIGASALNLASIGDVTVQAQVIEPPLFVCGPTGTTFYSAAVRVKLGVDLVDVDTASTLPSATNVGVALEVAHIDLYLDVARGEGTIEAIQTNAPAAVTVQALPGLVDIYVGQLDDLDFFTTQPIDLADLDPAGLATLTVTLPGVPNPLAPIGGQWLLAPPAPLVADVDFRTWATSTVSSVPDLVFTGDPANSGNFPQTQTASTGVNVVSDFVTELLANLELDADLEVQLDGLLGDVVDGLLNTVVTALNLLLGVDDILDLTQPILDLVGDTLLPNLLSPVLDTVLGDIADPLLDSLGIGLGEMDVTVLGVTPVCAALTVNKSNSSLFTAGVFGQYTIQVTNTGFLTTTPPITVVDTLPISLTYNSHSGTGWTVVPPTTGQRITFTHATPLAPGGVLPSLILTVDVAANAPGVVINSVTVTSTGNQGGVSSQDAITTTITGTGDQDGDGEPDGTDPDDNNPCIPNPGAGLCDQEPDGLTNTEETFYGTNPTDADTDDDTFSDGNEIDNATDPLDACDPNLNAAPCDQEPDGLTNDEEATNNTDPTDPDTDDDGLLDGDEVDNSTDPLDPCDPNPNAAACDSDNDGTPDGTDPDDTNPCIPVANSSRCPVMSVRKSHSGNFATLTAGQYSVQITNTGQLTTSSPVTVVDTLPISLTYASHAGTGWTLVSNVGQVVTFANSNTLIPGAVLPTLIITVNVAADAPAVVVNSVTVTTTNNVNSAASLGQDTTFIDQSDDNDGDGEVGDNDPDDNDPCVPSDTAAACDNDDDGTPDGNDPDDNNPCIPVAADTRCPEMTVNKSHIGNFATVTQNYYTVQITNTGALTTSSPVTVVDTLPVSLTYVSHAGTGWTLASNVGQIVTFVNSSSVAPGALMPALTITVSIPISAPSPVSNSVSVTTTNNVNSAVSLDTDSTIIVASPDNDEDGEIGDNDPDDNDPCVPSDTAAACDNDDDGTPDGTDPDDTDPCVPNVNAANCDNDDDGTPVATDPDDNDPCVPNANAATCDNDDDGTPVATDPDDNDPCVPNANAATCDNDDDGTPDGTDPDDNDPCVPNANASNCDNDDDGTPVDTDPDDNDPCTPNPNVAACDGDDDGTPDGTDPDDMNSCAPVAIGARCPLLSIDKSHTGNFATVTNGLYTIQVRNIGQRATSAPIFVVDTLPAGMSYHSFAGSGWNVVGNTSSATLTFVNSGNFAPNVSLPTLLLTVSIASDAPGMVVNTVSVTTTNNAGKAQSLDADTTIINGSPDADGDGFIGNDDPDDTNPCVPDNEADVCDRDGDGLNNVEEDQNNTNPDDPDTDDDGINDGDEVDGESDPLDPCDPSNTVPACDRDNDGLNNGEEGTRGTDPDNPDTDDDGITDGDEVDDGTDPLNPCDPSNTVPACDRDNDGLNNGEEAEAGTDPDDPDTDNDGVLDGADPAPLNPCIPNGNADACPTGLGEWDFYFFLPQIDEQQDVVPTVR